MNVILKFVMHMVIKNSDLVNVILLDFHLKRNNNSFLLFTLFAHRWRCSKIFFEIIILFSKEFSFIYIYVSLVNEKKLASSLVLRWIDPHC